MLMFLFYFENVAITGKKEEDKVLELLTFFDGRAFEFLFGCFTKNGK